MSYEAVNEERTGQHDGFASMAGEALREHLEELVGANVLLRSAPWSEQATPKATEGGAPLEIVGTGEPGRQQGRVTPESIAWSCFRLTGTARGALSIGAAPRVVAQLMQLAMSEPVDTAATDDVAVGGDRTGTAETIATNVETRDLGSTGGPIQPTAAQLSIPLREAWTGLLRDALRPIPEGLRSAFGWNVLLASESCSDLDAEQDERAAEQEGRAAGQTDGWDGLVWERSFELESGGLILPLVVRTFLRRSAAAEMGEMGEAAQAPQPAPSPLPGSFHVASASGGGSGTVVGYAEGGSANSHEWEEDSEKTARSEEPDGMDLLMDIELEATLRFGSRELSLHEVLSLGPGGVIELDRHVNDPVDLVVADKIVARGEVVLVNGNFGLRVTEVAAPQLRLESIRCLF